MPAIETEPQLGAINPISHYGYAKGNEIEKKKKERKEKERRKRDPKLRAGK